jgi:glycosyltransferase involved in cell wall biosynthesis
MKILMLNYEYPPLGGGAGNANRYLLETLAAGDSPEIDLVTSSTRETYTEHLSDRITLHFVDIGKRGSLHYQTNRDLLAFAWHGTRYARRLMRDNDYAFCHAFFGVPCGGMARWLGLPTIIALRGSDVPWYNPRFKHLDRFLFQWLSPWLWRRSLAVVANSQGLRQLALRTAPQQAIEVIENGIDTQRFHPGERAAGHLRILCVARLIRRKGIDHLLQALAQLPRKTCTLTVVGTGDIAEELDQQAAALAITEDVTFRGHVDHADLAEVYRAHDVFVLPSLNEGMSNTVLEALASGLPVILTETGGTAELLREGVNGYLIRKSDPADIAARLQHYLDDSALLSTHGAASRTIAEQKDWRHVADAYRALYARVGEGRS